MTARTKRTLFAGIIVATVGCGIMLLLAAVAGGSAGGTLASGRSVMTYSDGLMLTSTFSADTATIRTAGHTIVVAPTELTVDGRTVAKIDESVAGVNVHVQDGTVEFEADGCAVPYNTN